jgi:integrase
MKKSKAKTKFYEVEGKRVSLPKGVSVEMKNGIRKVTVTWSEHGKVRRKYFDYSLEGVEQAKDINATKKQELKRFGQEFGTISDDEKQALDLWRAYTKEAMANGFNFSSAYEVMQRGLNGMNTTTPDFRSLARFYFEKELMRKTDGELTEHAETVKRRLFNHICPTLGGRPAHTITEEEVEAFLNSLKGIDGKRASVNTREQYLNLLKTVFKFCIKRGQIPATYNPVANLNPPSKKKIEEPETLSVEEVKRIFAFVKNTPRYHKFIPVLAVGFFCGARVDERAKITYRDIFVGGRNEIYISAANAKNGEARYIYPSENFRSWMDFAKAHGVTMHPTEYLLTGNSVKQRRDAHSSFLRTLTRETGIKLPKNCIRHTAASFMAERHGYTSTANQLGHDIAMLLKHYRRAITKTEAEAYYNITPDSV